MRHVLLVGATEGIGRALAGEYLQRGWRVAVVGRSPAKLDSLVAELREAHPRRTVVGVACDVTEDGRVAAAFRDAVGALGQLDLLVYCAGAMPARPEDPEGAFRAAREAFEVNVLGAVHFLELAADHLAAAGGGTIAAIGSVAGERVRKGNPAYGASKAALHGYLEGLRHRLHGTGVRVVTVKPGFVRTRMLGDARAPGAIAPEDAARRISRGIRRGRESFFVPGWWRLVSLALRATPRALFKRIGPA
jgi:decaprenylphospho-beta-D-erythro-pentofuranosid-2-ulose 2-reductase